MYFRNFFPFKLGPQHSSYR